MPPVEFETENPSSKWPQTHGLDRAAAGKDSDELLFCGKLTDQLGNYQLLNKVLVFRRVRKIAKSDY